MKFSNFHFTKKAAGWCAAFLFAMSRLSAQVPQDIPDKKYDFDWSSWSDRILFIGLPILIILLVLLRRRLILKDKNNI